MAIHKTARLWLIIGATPIVLIAAALLTAKIFFTSNRLKALIIPKMEEASHRSIRMNTISLSFFPPFGIDIEGLKVSNPEGPAFEHEEFLTLDRLTLEVKLFELIRNKLEVSRVILNHPMIFLEVSRDGRKNYSATQPGHVTSDE